MFKRNTDLNTILYKCSRGNQRAQEDLYRMHYGYAMSIALRFSDTKESAVEIANDSFLKTFNYLVDGGEIKEFKPWIRRTIINKSIDYYRKNSKLKENIAFEDNLPEVAIGNEILASLSAEEILDRLQQLPDMYRLVFVLYEIEGYAHKEISQQLSISEAASRKTLSRAKSQLKTILKTSGIYEQA